MDKKRLLQVKVWGLGLLVTVLAVTVWAQERLGRGALSIYDVFPLLGLLAFSLMWTHYIAGALRRYFGQDKKVLKPYMVVTSVAVLALILLHPALLWYQLWRDGLGLPPQSYLTAYPEPQHIALLLGSMSLVIFLCFELKKFFGKKQWWKYIEYLQIVAMFAIFYHGLTLGREFTHVWYRLVWFVYGVTLVVAITYNYQRDKTKVKEAK